MKYITLGLALLFQTLTASAQTDTCTTKSASSKARIQGYVHALTSAKTSQDRKDSLTRIIEERIDENQKFSDKKKARLHKQHLWLKGVDEKLSDKYRSTKNYDTLYLRRPEQMLTFKLTTSLAGMAMDTRGTQGDVAFRSRMTTDLNFTTSLSFSYQGLGASLSFNPLKLAGKNKDYELNLNAYYNRWGIDVIYQNAKTMNGYIKMCDTQMDVERGDLNTKMLAINGYYAFNYRRFSFPAAFTQSYIQQRSAGSFLVGLSFLGESLKTERELGDALREYRIYAGHLALGAGYGYNWVLPHRWMIHVSFLPTIVAYNRNNVTINGVKETEPYYFPDFIFTERASILHYFTSRSFLSATAIVNNSVFGRPDRQSFVYNKWRVRVSLGYRL